MNIERARFDKDGKCYIERINFKGIIKRDYGSIKICSHCKIKFFSRYDKKGEYCSNKCQMVAKSPNAKYFDGKLLNERGYVLVKEIGFNRMKSGYSYEHRIIAEKKIGRPLSKDEEVHHIDGNKTNNHPDNLQVMSGEEHARLHGKARGFV